MLPQFMSNLLQTKNYVYLSHDKM
uniref:Uncharacterized protein n=1 Tax=Arundo donax TaxID=35708 RepID=A0A0A8ZT57_ARUDO